MFLLTVSYRTVPRNLGSIGSTVMWHHIALRAREFGMTAFCVVLGFGFWIVIWLIGKSVNSRWNRYTIPQEEDEFKAPRIR